MKTTGVLYSDSIRRVAVAGLVAGAVGLGGCAALAGPDVPPERYTLKDGTTLFVDANGTMRMFSADGSTIHMRDGVPMETADGKVIAMRENVLWKELRTRGTLSPKSR